MDYSNAMQHVYKNIEEYNPGKKRKVLKVFDDMINNKELNPIVTELCIRGKKTCLRGKDRLNSTHFFIMKIPNKRKLKQIALNHSSDIDSKDFMKIYKKCTAEPYSFLVNDVTLLSDNSLRFRKNLLK